MATKMDALVIDDFLLLKKDQPEASPIGHNGYEKTAKHSAISLD